MYLVKLIKDKKPEVDVKTVEYVITYLMKEGHMAYTVEYHYEICDFFKKCVDHYKTLDLPIKCAVQDTCQHFGITERWIYMLLKKTEQNGSV
jgi:uncharacterized protein (DUF608 family)